MFPVHIGAFLQRHVQRNEQHHDRREQVEAQSPQQVQQLHRVDKFLCGRQQSNKEGGRWQAWVTVRDQGTGDADKKSMFLQRLLGGDGECQGFFVQHEGGVGGGGGVGRDGMGFWKIVRFLFGRSSVSH